MKKKLTIGMLIALIIAVILAVVLYQREIDY